MQIIKELMTSSVMIIIYLQSVLHVMSVLFSSLCLQMHSKRFPCVWKTSQSGECIEKAVNFMSKSLVIRNKR
ncbi:CLUMA_CG001598, isoform A [Clunio marinus]|uniref:CLUMA_CG001598, isoform A n=1 Tax=Clunio marinus TaxID=568069 RepID=A0A1J1HNK1_9DIPT|nr:CLUMA_CG001598, isoform A [Clunio marinus]